MEFDESVVLLSRDCSDHADQTFVRKRLRTWQPTRRWSTIVRLGVEGGPGWSNRVYRATDRATGDHVIVRVFGPHANVHAQSASVKRALRTLERHQIVPRTLSTFDGGCIEQFFRGVPATRDVIRQCACSVMTLVRNTHDITSSMAEARAQECPQNPAAWLRRAEAWIDALPMGDDDSDDSVRSYWANKVDALSRRIDAAHDADFAPALLTRLVLCHNDLQAGNILSDWCGDARVVDWEFADWNTAAFDLANFACEWAYAHDSTNPDWAFFPSEVELRALVSDYLRTTDEATVTAGTALVRQYCAVSDLHWTLWAFANGHVEYAERRAVSGYCHLSSVAMDGAK